MNPLFNKGWSSNDQLCRPLLPDSFRLFLVNQFNWYEVNYNAVILDDKINIINIKWVIWEIKSIKELILIIRRIKALNPEVNTNTLIMAIGYVVNIHCRKGLIQINEIGMLVKDALSDFDPNSLNLLNSSVRILFRPGMFTKKEKQSFSGRFSSNRATSENSIYDVIEKHQGLLKVTVRFLATQLNVCTKTIDRAFKVNPELKQFMLDVNDVRKQK